MSLIDRSRWSAQGKIYRQIVPRWLEFGLVEADQTLWVEVFDN
jgi:hypothetical protein